MDFDVNFGTLTYESGPGYYDDFPYTEEPVYILGESYSAKYDRDELRHDIISRLWITYRRHFPHIGGTGPSSDQGWGCMLRCGQMMLAQVLLVRHLGRQWRWDCTHTDDVYWKILRMFEDKKASIYSIHQIASMGEAEGKAVGQWFGPNTIAQVLKRIAVYDKWSDIAIHVALDNLVVVDEIRKVCKSPPAATTNGNDHEIPDDVRFSKFVNDATEKSDKQSHEENIWRPLFLVIPLRLGLTEINPIYFESIKKCFRLKQSVGIVGGKPNHAHWFVGYFGKELIYLDPHTTQPVVDLESWGASDQTYHCCAPPSRMSFNKLDPSIALGFYCNTERDFDQLCETFSATDCSYPSMFEVRKDAPPMWPEGSNASSGAVGGKQRKMSLSDFTDDAAGPTEYSSGLDDEEFEII